MKKRILALALAIMMCLSSVSVLAASDSATEGNSKYGNVFPYTGFNSSTNLLDNTTWVEDASAGGGYLKCAGATSSKNINLMAIPILPTETVDFYVDLRMPEGTASLTVSTAAPSTVTDTHAEKTITYISDRTITDKWKTYHFSVEFPENKTDKYGYTLEYGVQKVRIVHSTLNKDLHIDNLKVCPQGKVEYDWDNITNYYKNVQDPFDMDDGFDEPQPMGNSDFSDVSKNHWAQDSIKALAANNYVRGMGDGIYSPEGKVTRAEFFTIVCNTTIKLPVDEFRPVYNDVKEGQWFTPAIQTAHEIGLINPAMVSDGNFYPNQPITREEAASVFAKLAEIRRAKEKAPLSSFADEGEISDWTKESVNKAVKYGLFSGYPDGTFKPKGQITRAEIAKVFFSLIETNRRLGIYVDAQKGNDSNDGTKNAPLKTIEAARDLVRPYLKKMENHIFVFLNGTFNIDKTIEMGTEDSGQNGFDVVYTSLGEERAEITAAEHYDGFTLHDAEKNIWKTYVGDNLARQVYINGVRAVRSRTDMVNNDHAVLRSHKVAKDAGGSIWSSAGPGYYQGKNPELAKLTNQEDVEIMCHGMWCMEIVKVDKITLVDDETVRIYGQDDSWQMVFIGAQSHATTPIATSIENAYELIDCDGEWYINKHDGYLYYKPRNFENPETMVATLGNGLSHGFMVVGESTENKVHNIVFDNLSFKYSSWLYPNKMGLRESQGCYIDRDVVRNPYPGDNRTWGWAVDSFVTIADAAYVDFTNNVMSKLGGAAITYREVFQKCDISGNHIYDVADSAMELGNNQIEDIDQFKYQKNTRYKNYIIGNTVKNNLIHDVGLDYYSAPGVIMSGSMVNTEFMYNEIYHTNYSGMHIGWGWTSNNQQVRTYQGNQIKYNYFHDNMEKLHDGGSVYMVGSTGGVNEVCENYFENCREGGGALYFDSGNDRWLATANVFDMREEYCWYREGTPSEPIFNMGAPATGEDMGKIWDNYYTNGKRSYNKTGVHLGDIHIPDANWPAEAQRTVDISGPAQEYLDKYNDGVQRLFKENKETQQFFLDKGATMKFNVKKYGRKYTDLGTDGIYFFSSNDDIASVDQNGVITCKGRGYVTVYAEYLDNDVIRREFINLVCDAVVTSITADYSRVLTLPGQNQDISGKGSNVLGETTPVYPKVVFEDPSIVEYNEATGILTGIKNGTTIATATYEKDGVVLEKILKIEVIPYNYGEETEKFEETSWKPQADDPFFDAANWVGQCRTIKPGLIEVKSNASTGGPAVYKNILPEDKSLISFDFTIKSTLTSVKWPSFSFNLGQANDQLNHEKQDCYLLGFLPYGIELQRFNGKKRTAIFGGLQYSPLGGDRFPNASVTESSGSLYEGNKTYSATIGAINVEGGVRIIFILNGLPIFDFVDSAPGYMKAPGYFGIFEQSQPFELQPFTGKRFLKK